MRALDREQKKATLIRFGVFAVAKFSAAPHDDLMGKMKVRLNEEGAARLQGALLFWESYAAMNRCLDDEQRKSTFIAGYVVGWERNERPPLPSENVIDVEFN